MDATSHPDDFERSDADPRLIALLALGIAVFLAGSPVLLRAIYPSAVRAQAVERELPRPVSPVLEVKPQATLRAQRQREDALLESYGRVDLDRRVARIPIERAIKLLSERGLPDWPSAAPHTFR